MSAKCNTREGRCDQLGLLHQTKETCIEGFERRSEFDSKGMVVVRARVRPHIQKVVAYPGKSAIGRPSNLLGSGFRPPCV